MLRLLLLKVITINDMPEETENQNYVPIPDSGAANGIEVPPGAFLQGLGMKVDHLGKQTDFLYYVLVGVVAVLFIGFISVAFTMAGILTDTWRHNVNSYIDYQKSEKENAENFNSLKSKFEKIETDIGTLQNDIKVLDPVKTPIK